MAKLPLIKMSPENTKTQKCGCGNPVNYEHSREFVLIDNEKPMVGNIRRLEQSERQTCKNQMFESVVCSAECQKAWEQAYKL